jgi:hypothetical protein
MAKIVALGLLTGLFVNRFSLPTRFTHSGKPLTRSFERIRGEIFEAMKIRVDFSGEDWSGRPFQVRRFPVF